MGASSVTSSLKDREANKGDSGGDCERSNVAEQGPRQPHQPNHHFHNAGHYDCALDLEEQRSVISYYVEAIISTLKKCSWTIPSYTPTQQWPSLPSSYLLRSRSLLPHMRTHLSYSWVPDMRSVQGQTPVSVDFLWGRDRTTRTYEQGTEKEGKKMPP